MNIQALNAVALTHPFGFALLVVAIMTTSGALLGGMAGALLRVLGVRPAARACDEV